MKNFTKLLLAIALLIAGTDFANAQYITVTIAGTGIAGYSGDGGPGRQANISGPTDVCIDAAGNIYFIDAGNSRIRKVSATTGAITTIAGGGPSTADGVPAITASITGLTKICIDGAGNLYIATSNKIRMISTATGIITTVAGTGTVGYSGDGGLAISAQLSGPVGVSIDAAGNIYISDVGNNRIRKITAATGIINTIAGTGTSGTAGDGGPATAATISAAKSVCVDISGNVFCANTNSIRKIAAATGIITTVCNPGEINGIFADGSDNIYYVQDSCGCQKYNLASGHTTLIANNGTDGYNGDGGNSNVMELNHPYGLCADVAGNVYVADKANNRIRRIAMLTHTPSFIYGADQLTTPCPGYASSINSQISVADLGVAPVTETWIVITPPTIGTLAGFPATAAAGGTNGLAIPSGTSYMPYAGYTTGTDSFQVQVSNGTASAVTEIYVSIAMASPGTISGASSVCAGSATTLAETVAGGTWSATNSSVTVGLSNGAVTGIAAGTDTIVYTLSSPCPLTTTAVVTINPVPSLGVIVGSDTVCTGATSIYTNAAAGGTWSCSNPAKATVNASGVVTGLGYGNATINYGMSYPTGCSASTSTVVFIDAPVTTISGADIVCLASTITLGDAVSGGAWSASNGNAIISASGVVTGVSTGIDTMIYTNTNSCGTASRTATVSVDPPAAAGTISGAASVCTGVMTAYSETSSSGAWSVTNSNATIRAAGRLTGVTPGIDTVVYTVNSGCHTATAQFTVTIGGASAGSITGPTAVCSGSVIPLGDLAIGGVWSVANGNASVTGSGIVTGLSTGTDTIMYTVPSTCGTTTTSVTTSAVISIDPLPDAGIITGIANVCIGATRAFTDAITGGLWSITTGYATISSTGVITGVSAGTDLVSYTVSNGCGSVSVTQSITVDPVPDAGIITGPNHVCPGTAIICNESVAGGVWTTSNGNATVSYTGSVSGIAAGTDIITYTVTNSCGSVATEETITIDPLPDAGNITSEDSVCKGGTIALADAAPGGTWSASNGNASVSGAGTVTGILPGMVTILYSVSNSCGAVDATKVIDVVDCKAAGISSVAVSPVRIFPNPASSLLNIEWADLQSKDADIVIADVTGRVVLRSGLVNTTGAIQLNISGLNDGVYILTFGSGYVHYTDKVVVSR